MINLSMYPMYIGKPIIYNSSCQLICSENRSRCPSCVTTRSALAVRRTRSHQTKYDVPKTNPKSSHRYELLSRTEIEKRMKALQIELKRIKKQKELLNDKVMGLIQSKNIKLNPKDNEDLTAIILDQRNIETKHMTPFQRVFWNQQADAARRYSTKGMRWHPLMIRWCLFLRHQSQQAYETIRQSGISLPSQRTLRDFSHHIQAKPGFSSEVDSQLCQSAQIEKCEEWQKHVIVLLDEMHVKEDLVFDKHSGMIHIIHIQ